MEFVDALEIVYGRAMKHFRDSPHEAPLWGNLCSALEECYPDATEQIRLRHTSNHRS
jgi:hypothetical protein